MSKLTTLFLLATTILSASPLQAQITPDTTLGQENSQLINNAEIKGLPGELITGGAIRGSNLFHSFSQFNVGELQRVYFENPAAITNILTRVTGNNPSEILGTLGVDGTANLFLINPNGVFFGENAHLDIAGSLFVSTADSLLLENGAEFSATNPDVPPLLTVNLRPGLQYGNNIPRAKITNRGKLIAGGDLTLVGQDLDLTGEVQGGGDVNLVATNEVKIRDSNTAPFIAAAGEELLVQGDEKVDIFALNHSDSGLFAGGDLTLRSDNAVGGDAHYWSGGNFRVEKLDGSLGDLFSPDDPIVRASGDVSLGAYVGASLHILAGGSVNITGDVDIIGTDAVNSLQESITLSDQTTVVNVDGGAERTLDIRAGTTAFNPQGTQGIVPNIFITPGAGTSADITVGGEVTSRNGLVLLTNQYQPNGLAGDIVISEEINTAGITGDGGQVVVDSRGDIQFIGSGSINPTTNNNLNVLGLEISGDITLLADSAITLESGSNVVTSFTLNAAKSGDITVKANSLLLNEGARLGSVTGGDGQGGDVNITTSDFVEVLGNPLGLSFLVAYNTNLPGNTNASGSAGNLTIKTGRLSVIDGGEVYTRAEAVGRGGDMTIIAKDLVEVTGAQGLGNESALFAGSRDIGGDSGDIFIQTKRLVAERGAQISGNTEFGTSGAAGNLTIIADESVELDNPTAYPGGLPTGIYTFTSNDKDGGELIIETKRFTVRGGTSVSTGTDTSGNAGDLIIKASEFMEVSGVSPINGGASRVRAITSNVGDGGDIRITTGSLTVKDGGRVSAESTASSTGKAGTLTVEEADLVEVIGTTPDGQNPSELFLDSEGTGNAGSFNINTRKLLVQGGGQVSANTSGRGQAGILNVDASESVEVIGTSSDGQFRSQLIFDSSGSGNAGILDIATRRLLVQAGGLVSAKTSGSGQAGILNVDAAESVQIAGISGNGQNRSELLFDSSGTGDAGELTVNTSQLFIQDGGQVSATTSSLGLGGTLDVDAADSTVISGTNGQFNSRLIFESNGAG
ncbi:MAG: filamentous hemagglutinin N-terminal domain-containing protein, partial [Spirulinaceae cyanobacterium]